MSDELWAGTNFQRRPIGEGGVVLCGACRKLGHCRLGLTKEELLSDGRVHSELICSADNEGGPQVAHGGWTAGVFDELLGHVALHHDQLAVTGRLTVSFLKPVPIDRVLDAYAWVETKQERTWHVGAELRLASTSVVLAAGSAVMVLRDEAHFERHRAWLAAQDATVR